MKSRFCVLLTVFGLGCWSSVADATVCFPNAFGVPGLPGPPHWTAAPPEQRTQVDDPRWAGSMRRSFGASPDSGTAAGPDNSEVTVRGLRSGDHLYLQYDVLADPQGIAQGYDAVYLGLAKQSGLDNAFLLRVSPNVLTDQVASDASNTVVTFFQRPANASSDWVVYNPVPAANFLAEVGLWIDTTNDVWTINLDIDTTKLGYGVDPLKIFYGFHIQHRTSPPPVATATQYAYPSVGSFAPPATLVAGTLAPGLSNIAPTAFDSASLGTVCSDGVAITSMAIGTTNADQSEIFTNANNTFFANPTYPVGMAPSGLRARFRLANWGAQIGEASAAWTEFASVDFAGPPGGAQWNCVQAAGSNQCPQQGANIKHQCMLVELTSTGDPINFSQASAWRNMDFETASTFERNAMVSIKGLPDTADGFRDVYLYVKTRNMPAVGDKPMELPLSELARALRVVSRKPAARKGDNLEFTKSGGEGATRKTAAAVPSGSSSAEATAPPTQLEKTPYEVLSEVWPTYEVHAYYDTGKSIEQPGGPSKLLRPMVPFGYYVSHEGALYGWEHTLSGEGSTILEPIGENWYRVSIVDGGSAEVTTTVTASEKPLSEKVEQVVCQVQPVVIKPRCHCKVVGLRSGHAGGAVFALLALGGVVLRRRRRFDSSPEWS